MALLLEDLTRKVIGSFFLVYAKLGDGLLENAYVGALDLSLTGKGLSVKREMPVAVHFDGVVVGNYRADLLVNEVLIVEVKTGPTITGAHERQLRNYLRCSEIEVGLILLFGPKPKFQRFIYTNDRKQVVLDSVPRVFPPIQ